jgi:hypothetical protein
MRTLSGAMGTAVTAAVTLPGYLVQIGFSSPLRLSTRGTLTWNSLTWTAGDVRVSGIAVESSRAALNCELTISNADASIGGLGSTIASLVLAQGIAGLACSVWAFYGEAPALGDPVLVFSGIGDEASIPEDGPVRLSMTQTASTTLYCPRTYLTPADGFSFLPTAGQIVTWNGETVRLDPEGI